MTKRNKEKQAKELAQVIKARINERTDKNITRATLTTSLALHISLEAIAEYYEVDKTWFKNECGVGQPLAYFI